MWYFKIAVLSLIFAPANPASIAGYESASDVTDYLRIDLDVKLISAYVDQLNQSGYDSAKALYTKGAYFRPLATLQVPGGLPVSLAQREILTGNGTTLGSIRLAAAASVAAGATQIQVNYADRMCAVGGLAVGDRMLSGCLNETGVLYTNTSVPIPYQYDVATGNTNGRSLQYFSATANTTMRPDSTSPYYSDFQKFLNYYGNTDYGDRWIMAALDGTATNFASGRGNANFANSSFAARGQAVKKGAPYMNSMMYAIRELEGSVRGCSERAVDEAVGLYTGSTEGTNGTAGNGYQMYALANKRSANFKTGGPNGTSLTGNSKVNIDIFKLFVKMQQDARNGTCSTLQASKERIVQLMTVPLIQGTLRYSYFAAYFAVTEAALAELAAFAASVLPFVHACNATDAALIYKYARVGSPLELDFAAVRKAFERNYKCLGVTCADVGGLYDSASGAYYAAFKPCTPTTTPTCKARRTKCTRRSQCCNPSQSACDGPAGGTRVCKACVKRRAKCARSTQCCPGLTCRSKKCQQ